MQDTDPPGQARRGVRRWVADAGRRTRRGLRTASPYSIYAFLTAAAVAPIAGPSLGATGEFAAVLDQLGGMGTNHLADVLSGTAERMRERGEDPSEEQWRDAVAEAVLARLDSADADAAELRAEIATLLHAVNGVEEALSASAEHARELHQEIVEAIAVLGGEFDEMKGMLADVRQTLAESNRTLSDMQRELLASRGTHRRQSELSHRLFVAVSKTRQWLRAGADTGPASGAGPAEVPCPYPGLAEFRADDAEFFHGREDLVARLCAALAEQLDGAAPLMLVGASG
ncbi:nSTAND1 domain-containing NTPase, partial [Saccharomonospora saliphila]|uniref:nSTAND1 domain-containing NTPase n=1 Tax=Saccharomonospora saliphila TaxID=369829 RepID=UPI0018DB0741